MNKLNSEKPQTIVNFPERKTYSTVVGYQTPLFQKQYTDPADFHTTSIKELTKFKWSRWEVGIMASK